MKTIKKSDDVRRVKDDEAAKLVSDMGWSYCPKSFAKKGKKIVTPVAEKVEKPVTEEPKVKKGKGGSAAAEAKYREKKAAKS